MTTGSDPTLGKVLLVQRPSKGNIGSAIFLLVSAVPLILVVAVPAAPLGVRLGCLGLGSCVGAFAVIMLRRNWMHVFLQEFGIQEIRQRRGRSLAYDQVDELTYTSLRIFAHGSYIHTIQKLALKSDRLPGPPLICTLIFREADGRAPTETSTAVVEVRDRVSDLLRDRFQKLLGRGATVDWTSEVRIGTGGLEISDRQGGWELAPWQHISRYEMDHGTVRVWLRGEAKPPLQISTTQPNFYPAYALARRLQKLSNK